MTSDDGSGGAVPLRRPPPSAQQARQRLATEEPRQGITAAWRAPSRRRHPGARRARSASGEAPRSPDRREIRLMEAPGSAAWDEVRPGKLPGALIGARSVSWMWPATLDRAEESWRMEASPTDAVGHAMHVTTAAHPTRAAALQELARSWGQQPGSAANALDWQDVTEALGEVRAI